MATTLTLLLLTITILLMIPSSSAQRNPNDRSALLQWKADYGNPPSLSDWNTSTDCCNWSGIDCEGTGRVQFIFTYYSILSGPISPAIVRLTHLTTIRLDGNAFTGPIPAFLARLTGLNHLSGPVPAFLARLTGLNHLSGPVPAFLARLTGLNHLSGPVPAFPSLSSRSTTTA